MDLQEKFDKLIEEHGAEAVIKAIKAHVKPNSEGCGGGPPCGTGYICVNNKCVLDIP